MQLLMWKKYIYIFLNLFAVIDPTIHTSVEVARLSRLMYAGFFLFKYTLFYTVLFLKTKLGLGEFTF